MTGDGDCCAVGTAHWIHALRYNMDMVVLIFDNGIYGLTKKQTSPTSPLGFKSKTDGWGAVDYPINPMKQAIADSWPNSLDEVPTVLEAVDDALADQLVDPQRVGILNRRREQFGVGPPLGLGAIRDLFEPGDRLDHAGGTEQRVLAQVHGRRAGVRVLSGQRCLVPAHRLHAARGRAAAA